MEQKVDPLFETVPMQSYNFITVLYDSITHVIRNVQRLKG